MGFFFKKKKKAYKTILKWFSSLLCVFVVRNVANTMEGRKRRKSREKIRNSNLSSTLPDWKTVPKSISKRLLMDPLLRKNGFECKNGIEWKKRCFDEFHFDLIRPYRRFQFHNAKKPFRVWSLFSRCQKNQNGRPFKGKPDNKFQEKNQTQSPTDSDLWTIR